MNQEDHNSNGYNAVESLTQIITNTSDILVIETMCSVRGLKLRFKQCTELSIKSLGRFGKEVYNDMLALLDPNDIDHSLQPEIEKFRDYICSNTYIKMIDSMINRANIDIILATPRGTIDQKPNDMIIRNYVFGKIREVLIKHGVDEIETPVFELRSTLFGQYGDASSKLVFDINDRSGAPCTLRFDLTVPFSRYVAQHNLTKMKRFQCGPVFRRDDPVMSKGRCRQFYQFDIDIAGEYDSMVPDAEIIKIQCDVLSNFSLDFTVNFNHKGLLDLILGICRVPEDKYETVCSSIDKLDKSPWEKIENELKHKGIDNTVIENIKKHILLVGEPKTILAELYVRYSENDVIKKILDDLGVLFEYLEIYNCLNKLAFTLSLARGLNYYTGIIIEAAKGARTAGKDVGSISGGGRYDKIG